MSDPTPEPGWSEANQRHLVAAVGVVRTRLRRLGRDEDALGQAELALQETIAAMPGPTALEIIKDSFGLSPFECEVLLLCAGMELDSSFAAEVAAAQHDARSQLPTFSLALAVLPGAHWSALTAAAPLRRWRLIEIQSGEMLTTSPLRIDERVLHFLAGVPCLDDRVSALVEPLPPGAEVAPSQMAVAQRIVGLWSQARGGPFPAVQLCGADPAAHRAIAATAAGALGLQIYALPASDIPANPSEREALTRLWERESTLARAALLIECDDTTEGDLARTALAFLAGLPGAVIVSGREPLRAGRRELLRLDVEPPPPQEQRALWETALGPLTASLNGEVDEVIGQFALSTRALRAAAAQVQAGGGEPHGHQLWQACRAQTRPRLDSLAQRIEPAATWDDLVLPPLQLQTLHEIATHVRQRFTVYETWGFAAKSARGLGISALFAGESGTGKTMAAEVLAQELQLDLHRIDLSSVVSKYIGETEKNLRRVFDAADAGGAILLFDEADALFGKRSEVKDSHDRYANIEVSYLLQRIEAFRGLAILTTNQKSALDTAFLRRLRFVVQFPFPDAALREAIWRRIFPAETPTAALDFHQLARLNIPGGNIRNIALNAAFLAAESPDRQVCMAHLRQGAQSEYAKIEKSLTESELRGWT
jgi:ATPase family associated with various cellular activities (AAA)